MSRMPNILDVATLAGVSRTTVSRVLNLSERVDEVTREKVLQAMRELDYQPSRVAQSLRKQKTHMIAVLIPRVSNPFYSELMQGIEGEATRHGYSVILCNTENDLQKELQYLRMIEQHQVDGIIMTSFMNDKETLCSFESYGPIVLIGEYTEDDLFPVVTVDHFEGAYMATEHLLKLGHRKVGMIAGSSRSLIARDREKGFRQALTDYQVPIVEAWIKESSYSISNGKQYMKELLALEEQPTAVFAGNDELAVGVIQGGKEQGLRVPQDMAVIGFDGQLIGTIVEPKLTTVVQPIELLGSTGMSLLIRKLRGEVVSSQPALLPTMLEVKESCGAIGHDSSGNVNSPTI